MAAEEVRVEGNEHFEWNVENEIHLFEAMIGYKPVGIHKHFHMACICDKFETLLGKSVSPDIIWNHLEDMYDLVALDKKETAHLPNETEEFFLPQSEFSELLSEKILKTDIAPEVTSKEDSEIIPRTGKETSQAGEANKKEKKSEEESSADLGKKEVEESETNEIKKGKIKKDEKPIGKRGKRGLKEKKNEENTQVSSPNVKKVDDESSSAQNNNNKGKRMTGKRSLRSRVDEASTPPPTKRARRI